MGDSSYLPRTVAGTSQDAKSNEVQIVPSPRLRLFSTILAEFRRALGAAQRYESLRYGQSLAPSDIPRRIFDEFYAVRTESERAATDSDQGCPHHADTDPRLATAGDRKERFR